VAHRRRMTHKRFLVHRIRVPSREGKAPGPRQRGAPRGARPPAVARACSRCQTGSAAPAEPRRTRLPYSGQAGYDGGAALREGGTGHTRERAPDRRQRAWHAALGPRDGSRARTPVSSLPEEILGLMGAQAAFLVRRSASRGRPGSARAGRGGLRRSDLGPLTKEDGESGAE
jgi:hypothetical protein